MMMPSEYEKEADGSLCTDRPLLTLLYMIEWGMDASQKSTSSTEYRHFFPNLIL